MSRKPLAERRTFCMLSPSTASATSHPSRDQKLRRRRCRHVHVLERRLLVVNFLRLTCMITCLQQALFGSYIANMTESIAGVSPAQICRRHRRTQDDRFLIVCGRLGRSDRPNTPSPLMKPRLVWKGTAGERDVQERGTGTASISCMSCFE